MKKLSSAAVVIGALRVKLFYHDTFIVDTHYNHLTVLTSTHNVFFCGELGKIILELSSNTPLQQFVCHIINKLPVRTSFDFKKTGL